MSRNVEIKARITSIEALLPRVKAVADQGPFEIHQDDTYFTCSTGRLKLRMFSKGEGELIYYRRADQQGPKESFYLRSPTTAPEVLRESLTLAYGRTGHVEKHRTLFLAGRTRIHLVRVSGLGLFPGATSVPGRAAGWGARAIGSSRSVRLKDTAKRRGAAP